MFLKLRKHRFLIYQLAISVLYTLTLPYLQVGFRRVVKERESVWYIGIWGIIAFCADGWGTVKKSNYLAHNYQNLSKPKFILASSLYILRIPMLAFGFFVTFTALTGDADIKEGSYEFILLVAILLWGVATWLIFMIRKGKRVDELTDKEHTEQGQADIALFVSSMFFFSAFWLIFPINQQVEEWSTFTPAAKSEYIWGGLFYYLLIHLTTNYFFYYDRVISFDKKREVISYFIGIIVIGLLVLLSPILGLG